MDKKYKLLTEDTIKLEDVTLYRIQALKDFGDVKAGDLGGYIEKESNLSHKGSAWVCDSARVYGSAAVCGSARVYDSATVFGSAWVCGSARVYDSATVFGSARVYDSAAVYGSARVCGSARVYGSAAVYDSATVFGSARVGDSTTVCGSAEIKSRKDIIVVSGLGSEQRTTTFLQSKEGVEVKCGCFSGTLSEFREKVKETHGDNLYANQYLAMADIVELSFTEETNDG